MALGRPILTCETRNPVEVARIACEKRGVVDYGDSSDAQILDADSNSRLLLGRDEVIGVSVILCNGNGAEKTEAVPHLSVGLKPCHW